MRPEDNQAIEQEYISVVQPDGSEEYITHFPPEAAEETQIACEF